MTIIDRMCDGRRSETEDEIRGVVEPLRTVAVRARPESRTASRKIQKNQESTQCKTTSGESRVVFSFTA